MSYTLISDIGGTNIRLSLKGKGIKYQDFIKMYKCADFNNIEHAILEYLSWIDSKYFPSSALLAIAAPIIGDSIKFSNSHWFFSIKDLEQKTNIKNIKVINDFEAQAYAVEFLTENDVVAIKKASKEKNNGRKLILGPGTGLGVSLLTYSKLNSNWNVLPTEAGHIILGSYSKLEQDVWGFLHKDLKKESFAELVISGYGIQNIYKALCFVKQLEYKSNLSARDIVNFATQSKDGKCVFSKTLELFFAYFGSFVSSMATAFLPYDGIFITGGIIPKLLNEFKKSVFLERYMERALQGVVDILESIDIYVITKDNPALFGLANRKDV